MTDRWRPLVQTDPTRPREALLVAGGPGWFTHAERLRRGAPGEIVSAEAVPETVRAAICTARSPIAGLAMDVPRLMGILNVTPDSFSDGGQFDAPEAAQAQARALVAGGADMLDVGGESTRPGAAEVPAEEELARVLPAVRLGAELGVPVSIDTRKASVAQAAQEAGASLVNDVSALGFDADMPEVVARGGLPVCLMHARGDPETMQRDPHYEDVVLDVYDWLEERVARAEAAGIERARIVVDPGIGFGKTVAHNLALLRSLSVFHGLGCPILLGVSRKAFIGRVGGAEEARARMPGSVAVALAGAAQGVQILRVHDVAETTQALRLWRAATTGEA